MYSSLCGKDVSGEPYLYTFASFGVKLLFCHGYFTHELVTTAMV